jgi:hypothetical protein
MARKIGRPVMLRISRAEEYYNGSARNGFQGQIKLGFDQQGRLLATDLYIVQDSGGYLGFPDFRNAGEAMSLMYQPEAMRWRAVPVLTNTPLHTAQGRTSLPTSSSRCSTWQLANSRSTGWRSVASTHHSRARPWAPSENRCRVFLFEKRWRRAQRCSTGSSARHAAAGVAVPR